MDLKHNLNSDEVASSVFKHYFVPLHDISVLIAVVMSSDGSCESDHMHRLTRAFAAHILKLW